MVPAFGVKQDAIPGFVRDTWFTAEKVGTYRGQCAELCGKDHAFMPIVVNVVSDADYTKWVAGKKKEMAALADDPNKTWTIDELKTTGEKVYAANCVACHQANGKGVPGAFPALDGSAGRQRPEGRADRHPAERQERGNACDAGMEAPVGYGHRGRDHLHPQQLVEQGAGKHRSTGRSPGCAQVIEI